MQNFNRLIFFYVFSSSDFPTCIQLNIKKLKFFEAKKNLFKRDRDLSKQNPINFYAEANSKRGKKGAIFVVCGK